MSDTAVVILSRISYLIISGVSYPGPSAATATRMELAKSIVKRYSILDASVRPRSFHFSFVPSVRLVPPLGIYLRPFISIK
jgi:hypothetical protein